MPATPTPPPPRTAACSSCCRALAPSETVGIDVGRAVESSHSTQAPARPHCSHQMPPPNATADATQNASHSNRCSCCGSCVVRTCSSLSCSSCMVVMDSARTNCRWGGGAVAVLLSTSCSCTLSGADRTRAEREGAHWVNCRWCCHASQQGDVLRVRERTRCCCGGGQLRDRAWLGSCRCCNMAVCWVNVRWWWPDPGEGHSYTHAGESHDGDEERARGTQAQTLGREG